MAKKKEITADMIMKRIRTEREKKGISQLDFAHSIGLYPGQYSNYETGKSNPTLKTLMLIWHALEIDLSAIS